jgi:hypothetical protein
MRAVQEEPKMRVDPIGVQPFIPSFDSNDFDVKQSSRKGIDPSYFKDSIQPAKEHYLDKEYLNLMAAQHQNHINTSIASSASVKESIGANQAIRKDLFNQQDELIKQQKKSDVLSIIDKVAMAGLVLSGLVSLGLTIFIGLAAVPLILAVANAFFAFLSGGAKIANSLTQYEMEQISAEIFVNGEKRKMHQTKTADHMEQQGESQDKALETFKIISQNESNKQETARAVLARS